MSAPAERYLKHAKECRRLAAESKDGMLNAYLITLAEDLEESAREEEEQAPPLQGD